MTKSLFDLFIRPLFIGTLFGPSQPRTPTYDEFFKEAQDGTAKYDDVWGAPCELETSSK